MKKILIILFFAYSLAYSLSNSFVCKLEDSKTGDKLRMTFVKKNNKWYMEGNQGEVAVQVVYGGGARFDVLKKSLPEKSRNNPQVKMIMSILKGSGGSLLLL